MDFIGLSPLKPTFQRTKYETSRTACFPELQPPSQVKLSGKVPAGMEKSSPKFYGTKELQRQRLLGCAGGDSLRDVVQCVLTTEQRSAQRITPKCVPKGYGHWLETSGRSSGIMDQ